MPGPVPKDPAVRQRTNKVATRAELSGDPAPKRRVPPLPKIEAEPAKFGDPPKPHEWHKLTRAWWRDVWRSPMAAQYLDADVHGLYRLLILVDRYWHTGALSVAAEIRLQQQAYGLTPIDRRRLDWAVDLPDERPARTSAPAPLPAPQDAQPVEDPRKLLRLVSG